MVASAHLALEQIGALRFYLGWISVGGYLPKVLSKEEFARLADHAQFDRCNECYEAVFSLQDGQGSLQKLDPEVVHRFISGTCSEAELNSVLRSCGESYSNFADVCVKGLVYTVKRALGEGDIVLAEQLEWEIAYQFQERQPPEF